MALSTTKVEYIVACVAAREAMWLRKLLAGLFGQMLEPTMIHFDDQNCVKLLVNPISHDKSKHVEIKYHYIRDMGQRKEVHLQFIPTYDVLTKPLSRMKFVYFRNRLGVVENVSLAEREC